MHLVSPEYVLADSIYRSPRIQDSALDRRRTGQDGQWAVDFSAKQSCSVNVKVYDAATGCHEILGENNRRPKAKQPAPQLTSAYLKAHN